MAQDIFTNPNRHAPQWWEMVLVPLALATFLLMVDVYLIPGFALPLLLLILLMFLAFRLPPKVLMAWNVGFAALIFVILKLPIQEAYTSPGFAPYLRTTGFLAGGTIATFLAAFRQRLEAGHQTLLNVVSGLPLPIIISDVSGNILLLNQKARDLLKQHIDELTGLSYFSTFINSESQGKAIGSYIKHFESDLGVVVPVVLRTRSEPAISLHASFAVVSMGRRRYGVTVIEQVALTHDKMLPGVATG